MRSTTWLSTPAPKPEAALRLFVAPHAGGGPPAYRAWTAALPEHVELSVLQPPGRGARLREPPMQDPRALMSALSTALRPLLGRPYVLLGHSLGAQVAYALTHQLLRDGAPAPQALIVSGRRAPSRPSPLPPMHMLPQAAFIDELEARYGVLDGALRHPELAELLLPALRADLRLSETWPPEDGAPLSLPLWVRGGAQDASVSRADLEAWSSVTTGAVDLATLPGGHFYLLGDPRSFLASVRPALERPAG